MQAEPRADIDRGPGAQVLPLDTDPDLLALHRLDPVRYPCLLESVSSGTPHARFDILFAAIDEHLSLHEPGHLTGSGVSMPGEDFLENLDRWQQTNRCLQADAHDLPFYGGWFIFLAYELAAEIEPRLQMPSSIEPAIPLACAVRCPAAVIRDHVRNRAWVVAEHEHAGLADEIRRDLARAGTVHAVATPAVDDPLREEEPEGFLSGVARIRHYITEGDVFQANLSRLWSGKLAAGVDTVDIYHRLRETNPAPFAGLVQFSGAAVISSSPERLFSVRNRILETRPIAGTRPRGASRTADAELSRRLIAHPKERAEHIMLIDLERNDLGRVCVPGSVEVDELMTVESYAHVHHIVSNVRGRLRDGTTPGAIIRAVFPGGTITGCPKVRCMEIITEIEQSARGPYTGALGYLGRDGSMDLNILIRTLVRSGDQISLRAGAGIVADSDPQMELEETRAKARGLLRVFE